MSDFSDYIIYADESGDHGLVSIDSEFPVFALVFCVISKEDYMSSIVPAIQKFKFQYWGHDTATLHEHGMRKEEGDFTFLMADSDLREKFMQDLSEILNDAPIQIIASIIDKERLKSQYSDPYNPYEIALLFCLERLFDILISNNQKGKVVHVVFESRGAKEDRELELEFRRICQENKQWGYKKGQKDFTQMTFEPRFAKKLSNSTGLQLADLVARPIALKQLRPNQSNRAYETIEPKLVQYKVFPFVPGKVFP